MPLSLCVDLLPPSSADDSPCTGGIVIIDTLRFTTTATQALAAGALSVRTISQVTDAFAIASAAPPDSLLLCGERHCVPIHGFDLGNSPLEYKEDQVSGYDLLFTTTNGTKAISSVSSFDECLLGALVNRSAVAKRILESGIDHWRLICAGTDGRVAGEDVLAAGAIVEALSELTPLSDWLSDDASLIAKALWQRSRCHPDSLLESILLFSGARQLLKAGFEQDIQFACQVDLLDTLPICKCQPPIFRPLKLSS